MDGVCVTIIADYKAMRLDELDFWVPAMIWLRARKKDSSGPVTLSEIAESTGMSLRKVRRLAKKVDWVHCDLPTIRAWLKGCNFDEAKPYREVEFVKRSMFFNACPMPHLTRLPDNEFALAKRVMAKLAKTHER